LETVIVPGVLVSNVNQPSGPVKDATSPVVTMARLTGAPVSDVTRPDTWTKGTVVVEVGGVVVGGAAADGGWVPADAARSACCPLVHAATTRHMTTAIRARLTAVMLRLSPA
jgi:hypothetical protein